MRTTRSLALMRRAPYRPAVALLATMVLLLTACGDDDETSTGDTTTTTTTEDDGTTTTSSTSTTETTTPGELPGEPVDIYPYEGAELGVVGVEADDVLNVRSGPGVEFDVVTELEPLARGIVATGHNRSREDGFWVEVEAEGGTGWANVSFLSHLGQVDDITTEISVTGAETMLDLGMQIAESRAPEGPPEPRIVVVDGPEVGDLGEITVDILGFADDAQGGERLHILGEPGIESFTVRTVERTLLCVRGVTDGLCT